MRILERLKDIEGLWSLALLVKAHWPAFVVALAASGSPPLVLWRYVQMAAVDLGPWVVYPVIAILILLVLVGLFAVYLFFRGAIRFGTKRDWYDRRELAAKAKNLSEELVVHWAEYRTDDTSMRLQNSPFDPEKFTKFESRKTERFAQKYDARLNEVASEAKLFIDPDDLRFRNLYSRMPTLSLLYLVIDSLNDLVVELNKQRGQIEKK